MSNDRYMFIKSLFTPGGLVRSSTLRQNGVCSKDIASLISGGAVIKLKNGYYCLAETLNSLSDCEIAVYTVPGAVISGLSAASLYGMTSVIPDTVHITVPNKGKLPALPDFPSIEITRVIPELYSPGITEADGLTIYDRERTVCDCLKAASSIGTDVAIEILRSYMKGQRNIQKLFDYAARLRIDGKLRPYLEALI